MKVTELTDKLNSTLNAEKNPYVLSPIELVDMLDVKDVVAQSFLLDILAFEKQAEYSLAVAGHVISWKASSLKKQEMEPKKTVPVVQADDEATTSAVQNVEQKAKRKTAKKVSK